MSREEATEEVETVDELTSKMTELTVDSEDEKELECHARMIAFFAHKGGVSKTTNGLCAIHSESTNHIL